MEKTERKKLQSENQLSDKMCYSKKQNNSLHVCASVIIAYDDLAIQIVNDVVQWFFFSDYYYTPPKITGPENIARARIVVDVCAHRSFFVRVFGWKPLIYYYVRVLRVDEIETRVRPTRVSNNNGPVRVYRLRVRKWHVFRRAGLFGLGRRKKPRLQFETYRRKIHWTTIKLHDLACRYWYVQNTNGINVGPVVRQRWHDGQIY